MRFLSNLQRWRWRSIFLTASGFLTLGLLYKGRHTSRANKRREG